jgi:hypothetical protein
VEKTVEVARDTERGDGRCTPPSCPACRRRVWSRQARPGAHRRGASRAEQRASGGSVFALLPPTEQPARDVGSHMCIPSRSARPGSAASLKPTSMRKLRESCATGRSNVGRGSKRAANILNRLRSIVLPEGRRREDSSSPDYEKSHRPARRTIGCASVLPLDCLKAGELPNRLGRRSDSGDRALATPR